MGFLRNVTTAAVMVASVAGVSQAQIAATGSTAGCFGTGCTVATNSDNGLGVTFAGQNFSWTAFTTPQTVTLGTMNFNGGFSCSGGFCGSGNFSLSTTFTAPPTVPGSGIYHANVDAFYLWGGGSGSVNFNNTPQEFAFSGGSLFLSVNDVTNVSAGNNAITGQLSYVPTTTTPEPSSMALLGTGLIGLVPMVRRRRK